MNTQVKMVVWCTDSETLWVLSLRVSHRCPRTKQQFSLECSFSNQTLHSRHYQPPLWPSKLSHCIDNFAVDWESVENPIDLHRSVFLNPRDNPDHHCMFEHTPSCQRSNKIFLTLSCPQRRCSSENVLNRYFEPTTSPHKLILKAMSQALLEDHNQNESRRCSRCSNCGLVSLKIV